MTASAADDSAPPPPPGASRRTPIVVAVLVAVALVVTALALVLHHRHRSGAAPPTAPATLTGPAQQRRLQAAVASADQMTWHATYRALGDPAKLGGALSYEIWQRPPDGREDRNGTVAARCGEDGKRIWTCRSVARAPAGAGEVPGPLDLLAVIANHAAGPAARDAVTTSSDVVGNHKVTCHQLTVPGDTFVLCLAGDGTPELIANTTVRYELVTVSSAVPASVFTP